MHILSPSYYFGPVSYYKKIVVADQVVFDGYESYEKQTYRNRMIIYGANGPLNLVIPIQHTGQRQIMNQVQISYDQPWQRLHWKSLCAAYRSSPYFEYYEDDLIHLYENQYSHLLAYTLECHNVLCGLLKIASEDEIKITEAFIKEWNGTDDLRNAMIPSDRLSNKDNLKPYHQVFSSKLGYEPDLSILDLLFNRGPEAIDYLKDH